MEPNISSVDSTNPHQQDKARMEQYLSDYVKVKVTEWQGDIRVDIRIYEGDGWPTKKGVSLNLERYKMLIEWHYDSIFEALQLCKAKKLPEKKTFHLGRGFYATVTPDNGYCSVDIRKYFRPDDSSDMLPTKKGVFLSMVMLKNLKLAVHPRILACTPEYLKVNICFGNHPNYTESEQCFECSAFQTQLD
jgi:hypothetical protein